jgi:nucleotide-binding universal stress UspA family protein
LDDDPVLHASGAGCESCGSGTYYAPRLTVKTLENGSKALRGMGLGFRRVIVPVTGDSEDEKILALANELSVRNQVSITLVFVVEVPQALPLDADLPVEIDKGEVVLAKAEQLASNLLSANHQHISTDLLQARSAGAAIVDEAIERGADAILMAARVRVVHGRPSTGETAAYVLKNAPCDVVILRAAQSYEALEGIQQ